MNKIIPLVLLASFTLFSIELAVTGVGEGIAAFRSPWALQVLLDLAISCWFAGSWMRSDARQHGISALPFLVLLPLLGSIATLAYVVRRNFGSPSRGSSRVAVSRSASAL